MQREGRVSQHLIYQSSIHPINDDPAPFPSRTPWEMPTRLSAHPGEPSLNLGNVGDKACATTEEQAPAECPCDAPPDSSQTPATSTKKGSFNYDHEKGDFLMRWANIAEFNAWHQTEELAYSIEFITAQVTNGKALYLEKRDYMCSRQESGGEVPYQKKHPDRQCKIGSKKSGCACQITIKHYHHTEMILGRYAEEHDHELGVENIAYTRLLWEAQDHIRSMLHQRVDPREIMRNHYLFSTWSNLSVG